MTSLIPFNRRGGSQLSLNNDSFYNMLDDFFSQDFLPVRSLMKDTFKIDVEEGEKEFKVNAEMPGVSKEEINLEFDDGRLTISVNRSENVDEEKKNYIHRERRHASMCRSVYLSEGTADGIAAKLDNGLLTVIVPKHAHVNSARKIDIES